MGNDDYLWLDSFAPPPAIVYRMPDKAVTSVSIKATMEAPYGTGGRRYIEPKSNAGPRGGDDRFRAAAKAARKARQNQRKRK